MRGIYSNYLSEFVRVECFECVCGCGFDTRSIVLQVIRAIPTSSVIAIIDSHTIDDIY